MRPSIPCTPCGGTGRLPLPRELERLWVLVRLNRRIGLDALWALAGHRGTTRAQLAADVDRLLELGALRAVDSDSGTRLFELAP